LGRLADEGKIDEGADEAGKATVLTLLDAANWSRAVKLLTNAEAVCLLRVGPLRVEVQCDEGSVAAIGLCLCSANSVGGDIIGLELEHVQDHAAEDL
jgi:hypothetical protein